MSAKRMTGAVGKRPEHDPANGGDPQRLTLRLEVTIDESHQMQVLQRRCYLCSVEPSVFLCKAFAGSRLERSEKLSAHAVVEHEEEVGVGLKGVVEGDNEWVVGGRKDFLGSVGACEISAQEPQRA
jgi:hypothetical protein